MQEWILIKKMKSNLLNQRYFLFCFTTAIIYPANLLQTFY